MSSLSSLVDRALSRLKRLDELFISRGYRPLVLFSGGKDSLVVLDLCYRYFSGDMYVAYIHIPGNTHEECDYYVLCQVEHYLGSLKRFHYLYRSEPIKIRGVEMEPDFFECARAYGIPMPIVNRWCMRIFKVEVWRELSVNYIFISGEKASDSKRRQIFMSEHTHDGLVLPSLADKSQYSHINLKLIYDWPKDAVLRYVKSRELKLNPLYDKIGRSGNCMLCPAHLTSIDKILRYLKRLEIYYPHWHMKILGFFREYMRKHRELTRCNLSCSRCPYMRDKNRYVYAKRIGIVLELLENDIRRFLR